MIGLEKRFQLQKYITKVNIFFSVRPKFAGGGGGVTIFWWGFVFNFFSKTPQSSYFSSCLFNISKVPLNARQTVNTPCWPKNELKLNPILFQPDRRQLAASLGLTDAQVAY